MIIFNKDVLDEQINILLNNIINNPIKKNNKNDISGKYYIIPSEKLDGFKHIIKNANLITNKGYEIKPGLSYNYFSKESDYPLLLEKSKKYYKTFEHNYDDLKWYKKIPGGYGPLGLDYKGQVAYFLDDDDNFIFEINSLEPIKEFGVKPIIYKELFLLSTTELVKNYYFAYLVNNIQGKWKEKVEKFFMQDYSTSSEKERYENFLQWLEQNNDNSVNKTFLNIIKLLVDNYFFGINKNVYVYHFKKITDSYFLPVQSYGVKKDGKVNLKYYINNYDKRFTFNQFSSKITYSIKGFEGKKEQEFCFIPEFHKFDSIKDIM